MRAVTLRGFFHSNKALYRCHGRGRGLGDYSLRRVPVPRTKLRGHQQDNVQMGSSVENRDGCPTSREPLMASEPKNNNRKVQSGPQGLWLDTHPTFQ